MLYKKYHRNYVSLFKFGARFRLGTHSVEIVDKEPIYSEYSHYIEVRCHYLWWKLIKSNGKLVKYDVI